MSRKTKIDWSRFDAMTPEQKHAAALSDPDAQPMDFSKLKRVPRSETLRRTLKHRASADPESVKIISRAMKRFMGAIRRLGVR